MPITSGLKVEQHVSREGMVSIGGNTKSVSDETRSQLVEDASLYVDVRIFESGTLIAGHRVLQGHKRRFVHQDHRGPVQRQHWPETRQGSHVAKLSIAIVL
ncbi:hypothetical protein FE840_018255 (plasmid) [Peteryoungia desertarenae]|uniref:BON domain-containing protein n=1 Tax=Peteryoungia desertarenae TaxID=1813451 RepID=A0ABX6QSR7_9HYPH|nr:hypothetical protein [Peteryoungia desertarenae]QLF71598.1 hypothetical protein FE840_018255 [Peteryoungia desertarenae]